MNATLVLDTTAMLAYARQSLAVGELLSIVNEDGDATVAPAACLVEASAQVEGGELDTLGLLIALPGVAVTALKPEFALGMGALIRKVGGVGGVAHAATEALVNNAQVATCDAATMAAALPHGWDVIEIEQ